MPIRPEQRALYPKDWPAIRKRILARAGDRCERCKAPNHVWICRGVGSDEGTFMLDDGHVFDAGTGEPRGRARGSEYDTRGPIRVVLTIAHLDHDPTHNDDTNLAALCQKHHLEHDRGQHTKNARATVAGRKALPLPGVD